MQSNEDDWTSAYKRVLVIGCGNDLRSDDGIGPWVVRQLKRSQFAWPAVAVHQLLPEHVVEIAAAELLIVVDASRQAQPGEVNWTKVVPAAKATVQTHRFDIAGLLQLARDQMNHVPETWLATVGGDCWGLGEQLSPLAKRGARSLVARMPAIVYQALDGGIRYA